MFKEIFELIYKLILQPGKSWSELAEKKDTDNEQFLKRYLYPVFGIIALLTFIGVLISKKEFDVQIALKTSINVFLSVFLGFYIASFVLTEIFQRVFNQSKQPKIDQQFVGYVSALMYFSHMLLAIFPNLLFFRFFELYTVYMIWEGASYLDIQTKDKTKFTLITAAIILVSPYLIESLMFLLMPELQ